MKHFIIGISGKKDSGKDTIASMINYIFAAGFAKASYADWIIKRANYDNTYSDRIIHFADPLKDCLSIMFNIPRKYFDDRKYKDYYWYCLETGNFLEEDIIKKQGYNIITINKLNKDNTLNNELINNKHLNNVIKLRTIMQYFGTDICRNYLLDNIWIKAAMAKIVDKSESRLLCIVPDVRFDNEAEAIRFNNPSLYGGIIMVKRDNYVEYEHDSENANFKADFIINNDSTLVKLFYKVLDICQKIK